MGIEPTARSWRATGFEDQEGHQTPIASQLLSRRLIRRLQPLEPEFDDLPHGA
jgi:hypothetical protein